MSEHYFFEPSKGHGLKHDPFNAIVAPRPIGWISSVDREGRVNLAPYSYFNAIGNAPPLVMFSSSGWKDSVRNVEATGEFVANLVSMPLAEAMNLTSADLPHGTSEMDHAKLESAPSRVVKVPRVAASPAALECKLLQIIEVKDLNGDPANRWLVLGQVVGVHIDPAFLRDGIFDTAAARTIARCGYRGDYSEVTELFDMPRPN